MKIFIIYYKKLIERKQFILQQFKVNNITNFEFVEIDRDQLGSQNIDFFDSNYSNSQIAITLSHFYSYKQIANEKIDNADNEDTYDSALILEDDVILSENFMDKLNIYMSQLPTNFDMLFIGDGCNLHIEKHKLIPNKNIYEKCLYPTSWGGDGASRCTDSYIVSNKCAKQICKYINNLKVKINLPIDWWINVASRENNFNVYWAEPTICTQGTQTGLFTSSHTYYD